MTLCTNRRDIVLEFQRDINRGLLYGKSDPRLVWWRDFPHECHECQRTIAVSADIRDSSDTAAPQSSRRVRPTHPV